MASKKEVIPSITESASLTQTIQNDLQKLLQQYQLREQAHAAKVAEFERSREELLAAAKKSADDIVSRANEEARRKITEAEATARVIINDANNKAAKMNKEKQEWEQEKLKMAVIQQFQPQINLDIGGTKLATSIVTLRRFPDTMIGTMFSGRHELPLNADGYHFIDRDGTHFRHILNFLRNPEGFEVKLSPEHLQELRQEAKYYQLEELMFPCRRAAPISTESDFYICNGQDYGNRYNITITQREDDGMWLMKCDELNVRETEVICCNSCKGGYVMTAPIYGYNQLYNIGLRNFTTERDIVNAAQPNPKSTQKKRCAICNVR